MKFHILSLEKVCFTKWFRKHLDFFRFFLYNVYQQKERSDTVKANIITRSLSAAALMAAIAGTSCGCALENMGSVDNAVSATASSSQTTAPVTETTPHTTTARCYPGGCAVPENRGKPAFILYNERIFRGRLLHRRDILH